ncbi:MULTISPECIES: FliM/FliN family flagellar motor switch protein [Burkholderia]|uniref:FliM/FliN family flagellar motor switch protein n=1 Tax=Burkholderia TaxID=32008 RepID=UPI00126A1CC5|nr:MULTISPECIES: FliM/FliN family flagellar motor C-terminal domain-containing protein [Burkholderia]
MNETDTQTPGRRSGAAPRRGELVPVERARRDAHPVRALRDAARVSLAMTADTLLARWCRDWGVSEDARPVSVQCVPAWDAPSESAMRNAVWRRLAVEESAMSIWWRWQAGNARQAVPADATGPLGIVQTLLFGGRGAVGGLAADTAAAAWSDWCLRIARQCGATHVAHRDVFSCDEGQTLPELFSRHWTGAVLLRWTVGEQILWLALDATAAEGWLRTDGFEMAAPVACRAAPLAALPVALRDATVNVNIELRPVEVALGDLMALAQGDVIHTQHAVDAPLQILVSTVDGASTAPLCHAYLGMRDGARAVVLAKPAG